MLQENEDGNIDPVHNGPFSYAYYHAIIIEGGRNDIALSRKESEVMKVCSATSIGRCRRFSPSRLSA